MVSLLPYLSIEAQAVHYTAINTTGILRARGEYGKHELQGNVLYISRVF